MKQIILLRILAGLFLLVALILFILHFTHQYSIFWFSATIACASVLNLTASIKFLKTKKAEKSNDNRKTENKQKTGDG